MTSSPSGANSPRRVLLASLAGTSIEFYDFYIYAMAAVLVFPKLFFPASNAAAATLQSFATFALAFIARPIGSVLFGHFGDRIGRKATLVAALLTMGLSTVAIGLLPTYAAIGTLAPILLALCRLGQGLGLGGEWGGAVLLATENAPPGQRAWYGMFPQLGAPIGFLCSGAVFLLLSTNLTEAQFAAFGWRLPFLISSGLVLVGLWVRLRISETPVFQQAMQQHQQVEVPVLSVFRSYSWPLLLGTVLAIATFLLFYILTVFCLSWGVGHLHFSRTHFLLIQMLGILFFAAGIPLSAVLADRHGRRLTLIIVTLLIGVFGLGFGWLFSAGSAGAVATMVIGFSIMGLTYGPLGTVLSEFFPTAVRYTGSSLAFNFAGIFGASLAPYVATSLATDHGLSAVGYYITATAVLTLGALALSRETRTSDFGGR